MAGSRVRSIAGEAAPPVAYYTANGLAQGLGKEIAPWMPSTRPSRGLAELGHRQGPRLGPT